MILVGQLIKFAFKYPFYFRVEEIYINERGYLMLSIKILKADDWWSLFDNKKDDNFNMYFDNNCKHFVLMDEDKMLAELI